ncbi:dynamin family protein, partial [Gorillibacterium massiliense]|uniref:dynamin family protein n=1 Tax=Gorillibacterium massiliense TaxID=1280390 RepID=UPI00192E5AAC
METSRLREMSQLMNREGDVENAGRLKEVADKAGDEALHIAFCGHFSAGKSTLINRLCGTDLLPSSPIPTSANVVTIREGSPGARIQRRNEEGELWYDDIPLSELDQACRNGADIESVEITFPLPLFDQKTVFLDTPGIDSTDDAHKRATESALHLADVVFYVTDYNHVQSDMNFSFTKRLQDWGKPVYIIVNQVDKHREEELAFEDYRYQVEKAFASWGIYPEGILYLTLKEAEHPLNEWDNLLVLIKDLVNIAGPLKERSSVYSTREIIGDHLERREAAMADWVEQLIADSGLPDAEETAVEETGELRRADRLSRVEWWVDQLEVEEARLFTEEERLREEGEAPYQLWKKESDTLIDNANLIPAQTRDMAARYLESRQSGFRVGLFGGGSKAEKERENRLSALLSAFTANVKAYLEWHLQDYLKKAAERMGWKDEELSQVIDEMHEGIGADWLAERVLPGAVASGEYTLTYSRLIDADAKAAYRRRAAAALARIRALL